MASSLPQWADETTTAPVRPARCRCRVSTRGIDARSSGRGGFRV